MNKPAERIYAHSFTAGAFAPENAVFIDDRKENLVAREALGMAGLHLPTPAQADAAITSLSRWLGAGLRTGFVIAPLRMTSSGRGGSAPAPRVRHSTRR